MILAAPLVIPFAEAVGISIATLGMAKAADMVNDYIQENPEESMKILSTIVPNIGIGQIFANKEDSGEDNDSEDVAPEDRTKAERAAEMKKRFKEGKGDKREIGKKAYEEVIKPAKDMEELFKGEERIDGSIEEVGNPKFDFTKFYKNRRRKADGGAIGIEVLFEEKKPRQGLFMGGSPLTGQALSIYNSMNAYGFDDQEIADALAAQGLYTPGSTPVVEEPVTNIAPNIINQGGGDGPPNDPPKDPYGGLGYSSANFGLGNTAINKDAVMDYEADAYEIGRTPFGQLSKFGVTALNALKNIPTPINLARMAYESYKQKQIEKKAQEEAIARDIARDMQESNRASRTGGYQAGYDSDFMDGPSGGGSTGGSPGSSGPGGSDSMGSFARGGLATMFTRKR